jgi:hypothetical protein
MTSLNSSNDVLEPFDDELGPDISYGGVTRTIFRNFVRRIGGNQNVFIPHPRTVAKSADKLSDLISFRDQFNTAREHHQSPQPFVSKAVGMIKHMAPGFIKSSIAGTLVFSSYEYNYGRLNVSKFEPTSDALVGAAESTCMGLKRDGSLRLTLTIAATCGAVGGVLGGTFNLLWDRVASKIDFRGHFPRLVSRTYSSGIVRPAPVVGTLLFHSLVSASLFGSYECAKNVFFRSASLFDAMQGEDVMSDVRKTGGDKGVLSLVGGQGDSSDDFHMSYYLRKNRFLLYDIVSIGAAGFFSGLISETLGYYLGPLESSSLMLRATASSQHRAYEMQRIVRLIGNQAAPSMRSILVASIPCSLGFLAYEFGKSEFD